LLSSGPPAPCPRFAHFLTKMRCAAKLRQRLGRRRTGRRTNCAIQQRDVVDNVRQNPGIVVRYDGPSEEQCHLNAVADQERTRQQGAGASSSGDWGEDPNWDSPPDPSMGGEWPPAPVWNADRNGLVRKLYGSGTFTRSCCLWTVECERAWCSRARCISCRHAGTHDSETCIAPGSAWRICDGRCGLHCPPSWLG
jgi:hypothetical protein